jgi:hypothetical protein
MLIDEVSIETTAIILWLARQGYSYTAIACDLDYRDVQPPTTGKVLRPGDPVLWSVNLVRQVINTSIGAKPVAKRRNHPMFIERQMMFLKDHRDMTCRDIADYLNECGSYNVHYGEWNEEAVKKVIQRYRSYCTTHNLDPFEPYPQVC